MHAASTEFGQGTTDKPGTAMEQRPVDMARHEAVNKKEALIEREQAAGRLGGGKGKAIVWDEEAVNKLLDRWAAELPGKLLILTVYGA